MTDLSGIAVIKPRVQPHTDRYSDLREWSGPVQGVCWHTTEGGEGLSSAEGLAGMMLKSKAAAGGNFAAYHYVVDADSIIPLCREEQEPYAQGGGNDAFISVCVTGKAGQTPEQWADDLSHPALLNMALITARIVIAHGVPISRVNGAAIRAGHRGICGHVDVRDAYHKTTHTDPGPFFPWQMMLDLVDELVHPGTPPQEQPPVQPHPGIPAPFPPPNPNPLSGLAVARRCFSEEDEVKLIRKDGTNELWVTNGMCRRHVPSTFDRDHLIRTFNIQPVQAPRQADLALGPHVELVPGHTDLTNGYGPQV